MKTSRKQIQKALDDLTMCKIMLHSDKGYKLNHPFVKAIATRVLQEHSNIKEIGELWLGILIATEYFNTIKTEDEIAVAVNVLMLKK